MQPNRSGNTETGITAHHISRRYRDSVQSNDCVNSAANGANYYCCKKYSCKRYSCKAPPLAPALQLLLLTTALITLLALAWLNVTGPSIKYNQGHAILLLLASRINFGRRPLF